jgi:hypothetical protein
MTELKRADQDWAVWFSWYQRRVEGRKLSVSDDIERVYAEVPDSLWNDGPVPVNRWIKDRLAEHPNLNQRAAAFQFRIVDDKIDALPDDARPIDATASSDLYDEAKRKAHLLEDRLQRAQADETCARILSCCSLGWANPIRACGRGSCFPCSEAWKKHGIGRTRL